MNFFSRYDVCQVFELENSIGSKKQLIGLCSQKMAHDILQFDIWCQQIFKWHHRMVGFPHIGDHHIIQIHNSV